MSDIDAVIKIASACGQSMRVRYSALEEARKFIVDIEYLWIKKGGLIGGVAAYGHDIESACKNFLTQIKGQLLTYQPPEAFGPHREFLCVP